MAKKKTFTPDELQEACRQAERLYGRRENFTGGADIGYRWTDGEPTKEVVVRVHVRRKLPESALESDVILPKTINGIPLDVIEGDYRTPNPETGLSLGHRKQLPFLMGGSSCGRPQGGTGTVGMMVQDRDGKWPAILSNWHVLAGGARARPGDPIEHPGPADLPAPGAGTPVARLERWMLNRDGDAAVARIDPGQAWLPLQLGTFSEIRSVRRAELGEVLTKSGRTTGVTTGRVDGYGGVYRIMYEVAPGHREPRDIEGFKLVALEPGNPGDIELSSAGGDSGSSWSNPDTGEGGAGLHFAGGERSTDPRAEHAIACHLDVVMERLNIEPLTFAALYQPMTGTQGSVPQAAAEWTPPRPDAPDHPWWPWWPWGGPHGPRPVPIWDITRMGGGEVPWPPLRPPYLIYLAQMPGMGGDRAGFDGIASQAETALPPEGGRPQDKEQRLRIIFAHVKAALNVCWPDLRPITIDSKISEIFFGDSYSALIKIAICITAYAPIRNIWGGPGSGLPSALFPHKIRKCETFREICEVIDGWIGGNGS